jgi:hypothetical protein
MRNAYGFALALHPVGHVEPSPAFLHAGFQAAQPADVRALLERMDADGVTSWNATMNQITWRSSAWTRMATGSRWAGSREAPSDAETAAGAPVRMSRIVWRGCGTAPQQGTGVEVPPRGGQSVRHVSRRTIAVSAR